MKIFNKKLIRVRGATVYNMVKLIDSKINDRRRKLENYTGYDCTTHDMI